MKFLRYFVIFLFFTTSAFSFSFQKQIDFGSYPCLDNISGKSVSLSAVMSALSFDIFEIDKKVLGIVDELYHRSGLDRRSLPLYVVDQKKLDYAKKYTRLNIVNCEDPWSFIVSSTNGQWVSMVPDGAIDTSFVCSPSGLGSSGENAMMFFGALAHELGHNACGHFGYKGLGRSQIDLEFEADAHSAKICGSYCLASRLLLGLPYFSREKAWSMYKANGPVLAKNRTSGLIGSNQTHPSVEDRLANISKVNPGVSGWLKGCLGL